MRDDGGKFDWQVAGKAVLAFIYLGYVFLLSYLNALNSCVGSGGTGFSEGLLLLGTLFLTVPLVLTAITILFVNKIRIYLSEKTINPKKSESMYIFEINFRVLAAVIIVLLSLFLIYDESNSLTGIISQVIFLLMSLSVVILYSFLIFKKNKSIRTLGSLMYTWCIGNVFYMVLTFLFSLNC
ncbi:MAG: hypothetical protein JXR81_03120 [Candidatus Goldbacteria bacterium]|nr:hypothetical protein [Candidatus Goldiibacteriota bacterium]